MTDMNSDVPLAFYEVAITRLETERGVHAETAVAALARMAGTFLFRSFAFPVANLAPGSPVFSDIANTKGPLLVDTLTGYLDRNGVQRWKDRGASVPVEPHLSLLQTQALLEPEMDAIRRKHGLSYEQAAHLAMVATGGMIAQCANVLDPEAAFNIAVKGLVESSKSVPQPLGPPSRQADTGGWKQRIKSLLGR